MNAFPALQLANVFFAGILAGMEVALHYGVGAPPAILTGMAQLQLRQALVRRLRILVPAIFVPAAVSGIAVAVLARTAPGFRFQCAGLLGVLVWIAIRAIGTVPINSATLDWDAEAPPENWKALVHRAERLHIVGVWATILAFAFFIMAAARSI